MRKFSKAKLWAYYCRPPPTNLHNGHVMPVARSSQLQYINDPSFI